MTAEVSPLLDLAHEGNVAVVLIHHERKSGGEAGRGIRGASSLFASADQILSLDRRNGNLENQRTLRTIARYQESPEELIIELVGDNYRCLGTAKELGKETEERKSGKR